MLCGVSTTVIIVACKMRAQCQLSHHFQKTRNVYQKFILSAVEVPAAELVHRQPLKWIPASRLAILHDCFPKPFPRILIEHVLPDLPLCVLHRTHFFDFRVSLKPLYLRGFLRRLVRYPRPMRRAVPCTCRHVVKYIASHALIIALAHIVPAHDPD